MQVNELIKKLQQCSPHGEVVFLTDYNNDAEEPIKYVKEVDTPAKTYVYLSNGEI